MALVSKIKKVSAQPSIVYFSDFKNDLDLNAKADVGSLINEDSVKNSIKSLLLTDKGERFFDPLLGSDIRKMLFENFTPATEQIVSDLIKTTIKNYEPRAEVLEIKVTSDIDNNSMYINIIFNVINKAEPINLELILNRIR